MCNKIKEIMSFNREDYEILQDFDFYILLVDFICLNIIDHCHSIKKFLIYHMLYFTSNSYFTVSLQY